MGCIKKYVLLTCLVFSASSLAACAKDPFASTTENGHYWQRVSTSDQIYMQGTKAQQILDRDIGRCVVELREYEKLGIVRDAISMDPKGRVLGPDQKAMARQDSPDRNGDLLNEHLPYTDFEQCMRYKGWERIQYVPFDVAAASRKNYLKTHGLLHKVENAQSREAERNSFTTLNE